MARPPALARLRLLGAAGTLALLSACASHAPVQLSETQEAAQYEAHARTDYSPPGPAEDPWGPYITEAAARFDVPDRWIREVMRVESGGRLYHNDSLVTSPVGAMGLMQVMPATFDEMRGQFEGIGNDPYDPHNSILAGTAYIRQMYDVYGSPGFLAAYNAGPGNLDAYLTRGRHLPAETRRYVAMIAPYIRDASPNNRSQADMLAMNHVPTAAPEEATEVADAGEEDAAPPPVRAPRPVAVARAEPRAPHQYAARSERQAERLSARDRMPEPPAWSGFAARPAQVASTRGHGALAPAPSFQTAAFAARHGGAHLFTPAMAEAVPHQAGGAGNWAIQVGAYGNQTQASAAAGQARAAAKLGQAHQAVAGVHGPGATLYRARVTGLSREGAVHACEKLGHGHGSCMVVSPDSRS
ncbi:MAG: lytic transglycosylase domain-containing protein [Janthinobacterium lividum]